MRIRVKGFRHWRDLTLNLPDNGVISLKGSNGNGKSSLASAIKWALYGDVPKVQPWHDPTVRTSVLIEFDDITIKRKRNSNILIVKLGKRTYQDNEAQEIINQKFGDPEIWTISSFSNCRKRNEFLDYNNKQRTHILNKITFEMNEEDPKVLIDKISDKIKLEDGLLKKKEGAFEAIKQQYLAQKKKIKKDWYIEDLPYTEDALKKLNMKNDELIQAEKERDKMIAVKKELTKELESMKLKLEELKTPSVNPKIITFNKKHNLDDMNEQLLLEQLPLIERRDEIQNRINSIKDYDNKETYTQEQYENALKIENERSFNMNRCETLNVKYNIEDINRSIENINKLLADQEFIRRYNKIQKMKQQLKSLKIQEKPELPEFVSRTVDKPDLTKLNTIIESTEEEEKSYNTKLADITSKINDMKRAKDILSCTHCGKSLRYVDGGLVSANEQPINKSELQELIKSKSGLEADLLKIKEKRKAAIIEKTNREKQYEKDVKIEESRKQKHDSKIKEYEKDLDRWSKDSEIITTKRNQLIADIKELEKLPNIEGVLLDEKKHAATMEKLGKLKEIKIIPPPSISSKHIKIIRTKMEELAKLNILREELNSLNIKINDTVENVKTQLSLIRKYKQDTREWENNKSNLNHSIKNISERLENIVIPKSNSTELQTNKMRVSTLNRSIANHNKVLEVMEKKKEVLLAKNKVKKINTRIFYLEQLKQIAIETESNALQEIVDRINIVIEKICSQFFANEIKIILSLYKEIKSKKYSKPCLNFNIRYKSKDGALLEELSGGEMDRVGLAVTMAFYEINSGSKVMILDESFSQSDGDVLTESVKILKENVLGLVIVIFHGEAAGVFDHEINVDDLQQYAY